MPSDLQFWQDEIGRSQRVTEPYFPAWQKNLDYYAGTVKRQAQGDYVNVNVDVYQVEQKTPQLFFDTPELQATTGVGFDQLSPGMAAHRALLNVLVGADYMDALPTVQKATKDCTLTAGRGATVIGYQPTIQEVAETPQPGAVLGLSQPTPVPIHEAWFWDRIPSKKFSAPADFFDTDFDKAAWLRMRFRMPLTMARRLCALPADFEGTKTADDQLLTSGPNTDQEVGASAYVDGDLVWYKAAQFDDDVIHPEVYRRHILIDGLETFADKLGPMGEPDPMWASPYQTLDAQGRLTPDSMYGNPLHVLCLRDMPDSQFPPSDAELTRPLVEELCLFRTQMVQERDINKPKFAYDAVAIPPEAIAKIEAAMTGSLIPLPSECFRGDKLAGFTLLSQGSSPRQTYLANDYIERDIQKTLGIGANQAGVSDEKNDTATEASLIDRALSVRLDADRKRVLRWYLKGIDKISALALRFLTDPRRVAEYIGPQAAMAWMQWRADLLTAGDPRPKWTAKVDSQLHLDAAAERKTWLNLYEFAAKDPLVNRAAILKKLFTLHGEDPALFVADQMPEQKPDPSLGFAYKGEDFNPLMPQFPIVLEVLAQCGVQISPEAVKEAQAGAMNNLAAQAMLAAQQPAGSTGTPADKKPAAHGGLVDKVAPLSKHSTDQTAERSGPKVN